MDRKTSQTNNIRIRDILLESGWYISYNIDYTNQCVDIVSNLSTKEIYKIKYQSFEDRVTLTYDNGTILRVPDYAAPVILMGSLYRICKKHKFRYSYVISYIGFERSEEPDFNLALVQKNTDKFENLKTLAYDIIENGLSLEHISLASDGDIIDGLRAFLKVYPGVELLEQS